MRVVMQNLWGRRGDWPQRRFVLRDGLRELAPDLVSFIEAIKTDEYDQAADLLGPEYHVLHQVSREPGGTGDVEPGQGASIASRWPFGEVRELDLHVTPHTRNFACTTLMAEVLAPEPIGPLLSVNHLPSYELNLEYERELQTVVAARAIEEWVEQRPMHVIVAGDLDADPQAASVRFWTGRQSLDRMSVCYRDAWESRHGREPGPTFTPDNPLVRDWDWPFRRIDYILVRCGDHGGPTLAFSRCDRIFDRPVNGVWASDHYGLVADLDIPDSDLQ